MKHATASFRGLRSDATMVRLDERGRASNTDHKELEKPLISAYRKGLSK
jgi:hypothetical protein